MSIMSVPLMALSKPLNPLAFQHDLNSMCLQSFVRKQLGVRVSDVTVFSPLSQLGKPQCNGFSLVAFIIKIEGRERERESQHVLVFEGKIRVPPQVISYARIIILMRGTSP